MIFGKSEPKTPAQTATRPAEAAAPAADQTPARASASASAPAPAASTPAASAPAASAPAAAAQGERQAAQLRYVDRPDLPETFVDAVSGLVFDGQTLRIELAVTRVDDVKPGAPVTGRRYPACRLVLPPAAAVDLINRMQQIAAALTQAGVVKTAPRPGEPAKSR